MNAAAKNPTQKKKNSMEEHAYKKKYSQFYAKNDLYFWGSISD